LVKYIVRSDFATDCGFRVTSADIVRAIEHTNSILGDLPFSLYRSIDYKTTSSVVGSVFCDSVAVHTDAVVNPIEKGHPDLIPPYGVNSTEEELRHYPEGLEVKCTVGNIRQGADLRAGQTRVGQLTGLAWQAHHREVDELLGLVWDFVNAEREANYPMITAAFYTTNLTVDDWGEISGTTGRNTKVTGMRVSGKEKMGTGWIALIDYADYIDAYTRLLRFSV
jgi:hypothetical protein